MQKSILVLAAAGALALAACSGTSARPSASASAGCQQLGDSTQHAQRILAPGTVYGARLAPPGYFESRGHNPGADVFVHANAGSSREYVERALTCHALQGRTLGDSDPLHPESGEVASVTVSSTGTGYAIRISGTDSATNGEIWRRARSLATQSSVNVEQLASSGARSVH